MKELTNEERVLVGKLWDNGMGINNIATFLIDNRNDMDTYYMANKVANELTRRLSQREVVIKC